MPSAFTKAVGIGILCFSISNIYWEFILTSGNDTPEAPSEPQQLVPVYITTNSSGPDDDDDDDDDDESYPNPPSNRNKTCALLFFGLIKDFQSLILPSIQRNIILPNLQCDIFLHTYNLTDIPVNERNGELKPQQFNVSEAYLLTNHVILEGMDSFYEKRKEVLERTRRLYHRDWGDCCRSHDNMIKQWNSLQGVWDLMRQYEDQNSDNGTAAGNQHHYEQVGVFRSDVYYTRPINIFDSKAASPSFARNWGYNDRLFYGSHENSEIWASKRFDFVNAFEDSYMRLFNDTRKPRQRNVLDGYHSETFILNLLDHYGVNVTLKDHCVWRVRSGQKLVVGDCDGMEDFSPGLYRPPGKLVELADESLGREVWLWRDE